MREVRARLAPGREIAADDFADLTAVPVESVEWGDDGRLVVTFAADLTPAEVAAVRRRMMSTTSQEEGLRGDAETYLDTTEPDLAEIRAQVERLTCIVLGRTTIDTK
jgi:hypothetical protein